jgi:hypothetical protein
MAVDTNPYANIPELDVKARENERRRKIAEAMFEQGNTPVQPFTQAGGVVIPMHWAQGLAQMAKAYVAKKGLQKAGKVDEALAQQYQKGSDAAEKTFQTTMQGMPETQLTPKVRYEQGAPGQMSQAVPQPQQSLEGIPGDQQKATLDYIGSPYSAPNASAARLAGLNMNREDAAAAAERQTKIQAALIAASKPEALPMLSKIYERVRDPSTPPDEKRALLAQASLMTQAGGQTLIDANGNFIRVPSKGPAVATPVVATPGAVSPPIGAPPELPGQVTPPQGPQPVGSNTRNNQNVTQANKLRDDFQALPQVKSWAQWEPRMAALVPYMKNRTATGGAARNTGDHGLVMAYVTATRPQGVRTDKTIDPKALAGLPTRIAQSIENFFTGQSIPDDVAAAMWDTVKTTAGTDAKKVIAAKKEWEARAKAAGVPVEQVFGQPQ